MFWAWFLPWKHLVTLRSVWSNFTFDSSVIRNFVVGSYILGISTIGSVSEMDFSLEFTKVYKNTYFNFTNSFVDLCSPILLNPFLKPHLRYYVWIQVAFTIRGFPLHTLLLNFKQLPNIQPFSSKVHTLQKKCKSNFCFVHFAKISIYMLFHKK